MSASRRSVLGLLGAAPVGAGGALAAAGTAHADDGGYADKARPVPADLRSGGAFDRFVAEQAAKDEFCGNVLLTYRGRTVLSRAYGMADKQRNIRNGPDTRFALASASKLFTAVSIHQLAQRGAIVYHDRLGTFLDGFPPEFADLTVHQLLTHTSGMGDYRQSQAFKDNARNWAGAVEVNDQIMAIIRQSPPAFAPGTRFGYSNSAYELLGAIVAKASGRPYYDYVRENVFGPAGMTAADWYTKPQWAEDPRIAHPYAKQPSGQRADVLAEQAFIGTAAGNAFAGARDMARFGRAVIDGKLLNPAYTRMLLSGKLALGRWTDAPGGTPPDAAFQGYGPLALLLNKQWVVLHNGSAAGEGAYVEMHPRTGWVSVVLSNYDIQAVIPVTTMARRLITGTRPTQ